MLTGEMTLEIRIMHRQGKSIRAIARELGISRETVRKYLRAPDLAPSYGPRAPRPSKLDPFKGYLKMRICDQDGMVWSYSAGNKPIPRKPEDTAIETNFYTPVVEEGERLDEGEEILAKIEAAAAPLWPDLMAGKVLTGRNRADMAVFIAAQFLRSPAAVTAGAELAGHMVHKTAQVLARNEKAYEQSLDDFEAEADTTFSPEQRKKIREFLKDPSNYKIDVLRAAGLPMLGGIEKLAGIFYHMTWLVGRSKNQHLITSDSPVARISDPRTRHPFYGDGGFANKKVRVTFPLSPDRMLEMTWGEGERERVVEIPKNMAREFNGIRASQAERFMFANLKDFGIQKLCDKWLGGGRKPRIITDGESPVIDVKRRLT